MKKLTGLFVILSLLLFVCICIPGLSNAQKLKPKAVDINKPGISKSVVKKPGLSSSIKSKLPALEVSRLALDSGCKITGFLQNKGSKMDAGHSDFNKIEIKVGYTFDGKTKEVLLKTNSGASADQPRLLMSFPDMVNFTNGRPAKFTSKLQVPATGNSFATVFVEIDPSNRIRETREGEQRKRIQKRLRAQCAPRLSPAVKVNGPTKKEKVNAVSTAIIIKPPAGVSTPQTRGQDFGIKVTHPGSDIVRNNVTIKYQFSRSSSPPDKVSITLKGFCKKISNGRDGEFGIAHIYDGPPLESHRVNLSTIDFSSVGIEDICQGEVKYFFEVGEVREVGETSAGRVWGYSRHFPYRPYAFARPGSKSVKAGKIKIDPDTKKKVNLPVPSKIHSDNMVTKAGGCLLSVTAPSDGLEIIRGEPIPIEINYPPSDSETSCDIDYCIITILGYDRHHFFQTGWTWQRMVSVENGRFKESPPGVESPVRDGRLELQWISIPQGIKDSVYQKIEVKGYMREGRVLIADGESGEFSMNIITAAEGGHSIYYDPSPVSDGLHITLPVEGGVEYTNSEINIKYELDDRVLSTPGIESTWVYLAMRPLDNRAVSRASSRVRYDSSGNASLFIPDNVPLGQYQIYARIVDGTTVDLATGSSGAFRVSTPAISGTDDGISITSPTASDHYRPGDRSWIVMNYDTGMCTYARYVYAIIYLDGTRNGDSEIAVTSEIRRYALPAFSGSLRLQVPLEVFQYIGANDASGESMTWRLRINTGTPVYPQCEAYSESFKISH